MTTVIVIKLLTKGSFIFSFAQALSSLQDSSINFSSPTVGNKKQEWGKVTPSGDFSLIKTHRDRTKNFSSVALTPF
jgi:hypothetical protein